MNKIIWKGCYEELWKDVIVPEAFSHPAKMSYGLLLRILKHVKKEGWIKKGQVILDPFGGIGSTGILGAYEGYQVVCVELEQKFVDLAKQNFELHTKTWEKLCCPRPIMIQGDSRRLVEIIQEADLLVSSPPFQEVNAKYTSNTGARQAIGDWADKEVNLGSTPGQLGAMKPGKPDLLVSSPPFAGIVATKDPNFLTPGEQSKTMPSKSNQATYGQTPGQLGAMKSGDLIISSPSYPEQPKPNRTDHGILNHKEDCKCNFCQKNRGNKGMVQGYRLIISSPPYAESLKGDGTQNETAAESRAKRRTSGGSLGQSQRTKGYGSNQNLGNLKSGALIISSPPWEDQEGSMQSKKFKDPQKSAEMVSTRCAEGITGGHYATPAARKKAMDKANQQTYGNSEGQLGQEQGETFWSAAKIIVEQCYQILKPGGYAIWVTKDFVRNKKRVPFSKDWARLCESVGFKLVHWHKATLVKESKHKTLFGHTETITKERKSFFRRLAESKGSPRIDEEDVLCMYRPDGLMER